MYVVHSLFYVFAILQVILNEITKVNKPMICFLLLLVGMAKYTFLERKLSILSRWSLLIQLYLLYTGKYTWKSPER